MRHLWILFLLGSQLGAEAAAPREPLGGLWSLNLSADLGYYKGEDLLSFYPAGTLQAPAPRAFPGFSVGLRRHFNERLFAGLQLSSLPKSYALDRSDGGSDLWTFDGLLLGASGGLILARGAQSALFAEAQWGYLSLINGTLDRSGPQASSGSLEGAGLAQQYGLGLLGFILPSVALEAQGGWRFARLPLSLSTRDGKQSPPSAPEFYSDFSGPYGRLGLNFFWGVRNPWGEQEAPPAPAPPPAD